MSQQLESPKGAMSVNDFALWAGIGRTTAWKEIRDGHLRAVKVSARTIICFADAESWLGESWRELADAGVATATLFSAGTYVYGPMPLSEE